MDEKAFAKINFSRDETVKKFYTKRIKSLLAIHILLEVVYILLGCPPMAIINIVSIGVYFFSPRLLKPESLVTSQVIILIEVYLHSCLGCVFFGRSCGFQFWLFGIFCSMWVPYLEIWFKPAHYKVYKAFRGFIVLSFLYLTWPYTTWLFKSAYAPSDHVASIMYTVNALFGFTAISSYSGFYTSIMEDNSDDLYQMATHDALTGLYNRQYMLQLFGEEIEKQKQNRTFTLCAAIVDIDFFKKVNDTYGHLAGDAVLKEVAFYLKELEKDNIYAGRYGGEEFCIFASDYGSYDAFCARMNILRDRVEHHVFTTDEDDIHITVSVGTAQLTEDSTLESFIKKADDNLYIAKENGRNLVVS